MLGKHPLAVRVVGLAVDEVEGDQTARKPQRRLDGVGQSLPRTGLDRQPVDHDLDRVLLLLVELRRLGERVDLAVDPDPGVALALQLAEQVEVLPLAAPDDRREDLEPGPGLQLEDPVNDLLRRLPGDGLAALRAVWPTDAGVQQAQVVVDLSDRADR